MLRISYYIEKTDFDTFFTWLHRLSKGVLTSPPVVYSNTPQGLEAPLEIQLEPDTFRLLEDCERDLAHMEKTYGGLEISYEHQSGLRDLCTIKNILRNTRMYDVEEEIVHTALQIMAEVPGLFPVEAIIMAEREWLHATGTDDLDDI